MQSFARIKKWLDHAKTSSTLKVVAGGNYDDSKGYYVEPTIIETSDPLDPIMSEVHTHTHTHTCTHTHLCTHSHTHGSVQEIFGPVLSVFVYPENEYKEVLQLIDKTSPYALTGAVFAQDR